MTTFTLHGLFFVFQPKISVWERPVSSGPLPRTNNNDISSSEPTVSKKGFDSKRAHELAEQIDGRK